MWPNTVEAIYRNLALLYCTVLIEYKVLVPNILEECRKNRTPTLTRTHEGTTRQPFWRSSALQFLGNFFFFASAGYEYCTSWCTNSILFFGGLGKGRRWDAACHNRKQSVVSPPEKAETSDPSHESVPETESRVGPCALARLAFFGRKTRHNNVTTKTSQKIFDRRCPKPPDLDKKHI